MLFNQGFTEQLWSLVCAQRKKKNGRESKTGLCLSNSVPIIPVDKSGYILWQLVSSKHFSQNCYCCDCRIMLNQPELALNFSAELDQYW